MKFKSYLISQFIKIFKFQINIFHFEIYNIFSEKSKFPI